MENAALFIDLPNFYSRFLKSGIGDPKSIKDYFLHWLDFDLVARSLTKYYSSVWVFYSGERIGPSSERIHGQPFEDYIKRINVLRGVTARDVNIPGEQREPISYKCKNCGKEGIAEAISEKGVDATLTVHLFDTLDSWDVAYLLSGDADFVPAVTSLRRRGKIVIGAGFPDASNALVRECYDYMNLIDIYLQQDFLMYLLFKHDGIAQKYFSGEVNQAKKNTISPDNSLEINWGTPLIRESQNGFEDQPCMITFTITGSIDISNRIQLLDDLKSRYEDHISIQASETTTKLNIFKIDSTHIETLNRRVTEISSYVRPAQCEVKVRSVFFRSKYVLNNETKKYQIVNPSGNTTVKCGGSWKD